MGREPLAKSYAWTKCFETRIWSTGATKVSFHIKIPRRPQTRKRAMSRLPSVDLISGVLCAWALTAPAATADPANGQVPNFSSIDFPWFPATDFLPPPSGPGPVTQDKTNPPIIRRTANNVGDVEEGPLRLADLNNSNLKPWVVDHLKKANEESLAGKLRYASRASCRPAGLPMFLTYAGRFQPIYFLQTPREVALINLGDTQVRHVYMNVAHSVNPKPSWYGDSVGHYEGDELVIDTIGFNDKTFVDETYHLPHTTQLHVVERFKLINEGKGLEVHFTVDDPGAFNAPWSAIVRYRKGARPQPLQEQPCAEEAAGGLSFHGQYFDVPTASRPDF